MRRLLLVLPLLALVACGDADAPADAPAAPFDASTAPAPPEAALAAIDTVALRAHIAALADDAMGGRGTGTPGEQLAVDYIIEQFRAAGLEGGMPDGSFTQDVPLRSIRVTEASPLTFRPDVGEPASFDFVEDAALGTDTDAASVALDGADLKTLLVEIIRILAPTADVGKTAADRARDFLRHIKNANDVGLQKFLLAADHDDVGVEQGDHVAQRPAQ